MCVCVCVCLYVYMGVSFIGSVYSQLHMVRFQRLHMTLHCFLGVFRCIYRCVCMSVSFIGSVYSQLHMVHGFSDCT